MGNDYGLRQYTPRRHKKMEPLSGGKLALVVIGVIVIILFVSIKVINKFNGTKEKVMTLAHTEYYFPSETTDLYAAKRLMNAMSTAQKYKCPTTELVTAYNIIDTPNPTVGKKTAMYELTTLGYLNQEGDLVDEAQATTSNGCKFVELYNFPQVTGTMYYPIVAPFAFEFVNANTTDDGSEIIIQTTDGSAKIIFKDVLCWFCGMDGATPTYEDLANHKSHGNVVGNSENSSIKTGSEGCIIGFGGMDTKIEFYMKDNTGTLTQTSWSKFYN